MDVCCNFLFVLRFERASGEIRSGHRTPSSGAHTPRGPVQDQTFGEGTMQDPKIRAQTMVVFWFLISKILFFFLNFFVFAFRCLIMLANSSELMVCGGTRHEHMEVGHEKPVSAVPSTTPTSDPSQQPTHESSRVTPSQSNSRAQPDNTFRLPWRGSPDFLVFFVGANYGWKWYEAVAWRRYRTSYHMRFRVGDTEERPPQPDLTLRPPWRGSPEIFVFFFWNKVWLETIWSCILMRIATGVFLRALPYAAEARRHLRHAERGNSHLHHFLRLQNQLLTGFFPYQALEYPR